MKTKFLKKLSLGLLLSLSIVTVGQGFTANAATQTSIAQSRTTTISSIKCGNENLNVTVLNDNANFKEVKVTAGNKVSIVKYDKKTKTAALNGTTKVDFNQKNKIQVASIQAAASYVSDANFDLTKKYSYEVFSYAGGWWSIHAKGYEKVAQEKTVNPNTNQANTVPFLAFRSSVNSLKGFEIGAHAAVGSALLALVVGVINTPDTLGASDIAALVVAAGFILAEIPIMYNIYTSKRDCNFYFNRAKSFKTTKI